MRTMRAVAWSFVVAVLVGGLIAGFSALVFPVRGGLVLDLYLLYVGGMTLLALVRATGVALPGSGRSQFELALKPPQARPERPPALVLLEQQLALAATTAFDVHFRLRPVVRDVAAQRLWARHAVDLESGPERAESLLGPDVWALARPDRAPPPEPFAPGLGVRGIEQVVARLEQV
jgi:hypothetical protein